jgi:DNA modification methylase
VTKDSTYSGVGLPEYVTIFRKWEGEESEWNPVTNKNKSNFDLDTWQKWASPVWFDIKRTDVLNNYKAAKDPKDEKHIAPLQLEVIKRLVAMWSNPDELVYTPFAGIGSELFESLKLGRRAIGSELKPEYFDTAVNNIKSVLESEKQEALF